MIEFRHNGGVIHSEHPFVPAENERDPVRRFRGRHAAGVSIVTASDDGRPIGLTVSSLMVLDGEPGLVAAVVGPLSDLWDAIAGSGRFVVHLCRAGHREMSDVFAGIRPSPGGPFSGVEWEQSDWGPVLSGLPDRAFCEQVRIEELGYTGVVLGSVDHVAMADLKDPLIHFRGGYHRLSE